MYFTIFRPFIYVFSFSFSGKIPTEKNMLQNKQSHNRTEHSYEWTFRQHKEASKVKKAGKVVLSVNTF